MSAPIREASPLVTTISSALLGTVPSLSFGSSIPSASAPASHSRAVPVPDCARVPPIDEFFADSTCPGCRPVAVAAMSCSESQYGSSLSEDGTIRLSSSSLAGC